MADPVEPPPLFENVDILSDQKEDDDLFISARQVSPLLPQTSPDNPIYLPQEQSEPYHGAPQENLNGEADLSNLSLDDQKSELENVPISNSGTQDTLEQVICHVNVVYLAMVCKKHMVSFLLLMVAVSM